MVHNVDAAAPLGRCCLGIAALAEKEADILAAASVGAVFRLHLELDHMAGIIVKTLYRQEIVSHKWETGRLHVRLLSPISSTAQPYRAISRALTIRLNASVSTTSVRARSLAETLVESE